MGAPGSITDFWLAVFILIKIIDYVKNLDHKSPNVHYRGSPLGMKHAGYLIEADVFGMQK